MNIYAISTKNNIRNKIPFVRFFRTADILKITIEFYYRKDCIVLQHLNERALWQRFEKTGSINDYLLYKSCVRGEDLLNNQFINSKNEFENEESGIGLEYGNINRRSHSQGAED